MNNRTFNAGWFLRSINSELPYLHRELNRLEVASYLSEEFRSSQIQVVSKRIQSLARREEILRAYAK